MNTSVSVFRAKEIRLGPVQEYSRSDGSKFYTRQFTASCDGNYSDFTIHAETREALVLPHELPLALPVDDTPSLAGASSDPA
jgi:hypothetical protein